MCRMTLDLIWGIRGFYRSKGFEAMKAGKLAILPWLSCLFTENILMDEPCTYYIYTIWLWNHTSHTKLYFNEFVANALRDNMGIDIFDLRPHEGC